MRAWLGRVLAWTLILAAAAVLMVAVVVPRVAGATPYTVATGSMLPVLDPGDLVVVRPTPADSIGVGDVITYQISSGRPAVVTHRVVAVGVNSAGERVFRTRGDANPQPDPDWVRAVQVRGTAWYVTPYLGRVNNLLTGAQRQWVVIGAAALLLGYAALMWGGAIRNRVRARNTNQDNENGANRHAELEHTPQA